ncbi:DUF4283 domain-containing protein [Cephalotus follicularis]|uniref:DUF4283 domain-containing protein n=1 Tax=Cephalotus follicularis TaxID=3775 RepID=A0A1Q3ANL5_CEPFO|nr:DUF4283 domain-containing protein [Cephalotus follicularis]
MWLRLPGLPLSCQNPAIVEVIRNSFGRFLRLDERTKKFKHPMSPRLCVEMDLVVKLPDEVFIIIGTEEIFYQNIEYDMRIGLLPLSPSRPSGIQLPQKAITGHSPSRRPFLFVSTR